MEINMLKKDIEKKRIELKRLLSDERLEEALFISREMDKLIYRYMEVKMAKG